MNLNKFLQILIIFVVVITIVALGIALILWLMPKETVLTNQNQPVQIDNLPAIVNSYIGEITMLEGDTVVIKATSDKNYLKQNSLLTIKVDANTKIYSLEFPKIVNSDPTTAQPIKKDIALTDLSVGQTIVAFSQSNLKNQDAFTADVIQLQITK